MLHKNKIVILNLYVNRNYERSIILIFYLIKTVTVESSTFLETSYIIE